MSCRIRQSGRVWAKSVLVASPILAVGGEAKSAPARYVLINLANNQSCSAAYGRVNKQLRGLAVEEGRTDEA